VLRPALDVRGHRPNSHEKGATEFHRSRQDRGGRLEVRKDGSRFWASFAITPFYGKDGVLGGSPRSSKT